MKQTYDVILVGGGMVGLTLAALLDDQCRVAIIDPEPARGLAELTAQFDSRVSALSRASQRILQQVGAWSKIPSARRARYQAMVVWDGKR
jgi:2-octaprenylphenol hydroxylase